eukprot:260524-Prymnesium_polylepis.1
MPRGPPSVQLAGWPGVGSPVEVSMLEDGLVGSRYTGKIKKLQSSRALVEFDEFFLDEGGKERLKEWCALTQLRPPPPPPPADFFSQKSLKPGVALDILFDDGWWEVELLKRRRADGEQELLLRSATYQTEQWVGLDHVRPRWHFKHDCWRIEGAPDVIVLVERSAQSAGAASQPAAPPHAPPKTAAPLKVAGTSRQEGAPPQPPRRAALSLPGAE